MKEVGGEDDDGCLRDRLTMSRGSAMTSSLRRAGRNRGTRSSPKSTSTTASRLEPARISSATLGDARRETRSSSNRSRLSCRGSLIADTRIFFCIFSAGLHALTLRPKLPGHGSSAARAISPKTLSMAVSSRNGTLSASMRVATEDQALEGHGAWRVGGGMARDLLECGRDLGWEIGTQRLCRQPGLQISRLSCSMYK